MPRSSTRGLTTAVRMAVMGATAKKKASVASLTAGLSLRMKSDTTRSFRPAQKSIEMTEHRMIQRWPTSRCSRESGVDSGRMARLMSDNGPSVVRHRNTRWRSDQAGAPTPVTAKGWTWCRRKRRSPQDLWTGAVTDIRVGSTWSGMRTDPRPPPRQERPSKHEEGLR